MAIATKAPLIRWASINVVVAGGDADSRREAAAPIARRGVKSVRDAPSPVLVIPMLATAPAELVLLLAEPREEAVELVRRLRAPGITPCPHVPVLVLTLDYDEEEIGRWIRIGVDYVCKVPIASYALMDRIEHLLANPIARIAVPTYVGPDRRRLPAALYEGPERRTSVRKER
jgi:DNA-binding NarL/FixJ family response regulator